MTITKCPICKIEPDQDDMEGHIEACHEISVEGYKVALRLIMARYGPPHPGEAFHIAKAALFGIDASEKGQ